VRIDRSFSSFQQALMARVSASSNDLFGASPLWPAGFAYTPDFIGADEESQLLLAIGDVPMHEAQFTSTRQSGALRVLVRATTSRRGNYLTPHRCQNS
jgi:hypothetical protein